MAARAESLDVTLLPPALAGGGAPGSANGGATGRSPLFVAPPNLLAWTELLGATQLTTLAPVEVTQVVTIPAGSTDTPAAYTVPPNTVAVAMSAFRGAFSFHSTLLTVTGWINYGFPDQAPITDGPLSIVSDFAINRFVAGSHQIKHNITLIFANGTTYDVTGVLRGTFLEIPTDTFTEYFAPYEAAVQAWMRAVVAGRYQGAGT